MGSRVPRRPPGAARGGAAPGGACAPWSWSPAPLRPQIFYILQKLVICNFYGNFAMFPYRNTYISLFYFCWCLKQGYNMFFMSCCVYQIHINIDMVSCDVMLKSLPIHNFRFGAFEIVNLDCTRAIDFFNMKWPFPPGK